MKLWMKLTCIVMICTLAALSVSLYISTAWQANRILDQAEEQAYRAFNLFCSNMNAVQNTTQGDPMSDVTSRSVVHYYFATYAHLLSDSAYFSLVQEGEYLYNTCPVNPKSLLTIPPQADEVCATFALDKHYFIIARNITMVSQKYTVYLCMDVSDAYARAQDTAKLSALMLLVSTLIVLATTIPLVRRALIPLGKLKETAESIAEGEYGLRAQIESEDEIASLAQSFNHMADEVESRIDELTEESERRRLLLGALAHELKTPMTAVIGYADSLLKMPLSEEQKQHSLQQILTASQRTERMTQKLMLLLSLSEDDCLEMKTFGAEEFADELGGMYDARVDITASGELYGERDLIMSLAQNLINNALNASSDIVRVHIAPSSIRVTDHGSGIPKEHIARLTEPFYRVDKARSRKRGGAGLGLALCRVIAEAHSGRLIIESQLGKGTAVTATLNERRPEHE